MDFYKKIIKNKDISGVLSEKEYKCVSLQAITNEAVKENNKERLKDLVEEINGHLTDLRSIKDDKDPKNKEKCDKLILQFEECLVQILNKKPSDNVLAILNQKLEELQYLSNLAMQESKNEELKKLVEKLERNLEVVKEMPEVKDGKNTENGDQFLQLVTKYEHLLKVISGHLGAKRRIVSQPMSAELFQKTFHGNPQEPETPPSKPNKIGLNEVEEKLKLMRQKRLNRLSTFVDQQSKLSEQRSRENSPKNSDNSNKSPENLSKISESVEIETAIKSIQSSEIVKPSPFRPFGREKLVKNPEPKVFPKDNEIVIKRIEPKVQGNEFRGENTKVAAVFKNISGKSENAPIVNEKPSTPNVVVTETAKIREWPKPSDLKAGRIVKEDGAKTRNRASDGNMTENEGPLAETVRTGVRTSFGKGAVTRSFAERQIENARNQAVSGKPKVQLQPSNSTRTTPPRTPTQIRKIFNSFNACVLGANNQKSIEDLPGEFKSPFEQELKTVQLKSTGFEYKQEQSEEMKDNSFRSNIREYPKPKISDSPPGIPKRTHVLTRERSDFARHRAFGQEEFEKYSEPSKPLEMEKLDIERMNPVMTNLSKGKIKKTSSEYYDVAFNSNENITRKTSDTKQRRSLDLDAVLVRDHEPNYVNHQPTDLLITVKRDSNTIPTEPDRYLFSTFRSSTGSLKGSNENSVENPLYGTVQTNNSIENPLYDVVKANPQNTKEISEDNTIYGIIKYATGEKIFKELIGNCNYLEDLLKTANSKELRNVSYANKIKELNVLLKDVTRNVEVTLDVDESQNENRKFNRFFADIINIENSINYFKGLKRDPEYSLIDKQLAKYYVDIDKIRPQSSTDRSEKRILTERLKVANNNLEDKVNRNEEILKNVLEEQVKMLGVKYGIA